MTGGRAFLDKELFKTVKAKRIGRLRPLIAIIDDDEFVRSPAIWALNQHAQIVTAEDGVSGITLFNQFAPDLVFLDIKMPKLDGIETLKCLLKLDPLARVVMFSASSTEENISLAMELGAKGFVTKPFTHQTIQDAAKRALEGLFIL